MPLTSLNTTAKRRDTLELKGYQSVANNEQIRQHCPELFDKAFYLEQVKKELQDATEFSPVNRLKSYFNQEIQNRLDAYMASLSDCILKNFSEIPFEYEIRHESEEPEAEVETEDRKIIIVVSNIKDIQASVKKPIQELEKLHQFAVTMNNIRSAIERLEGSLPNFEEHLRQYEIEIETLKGELSDILEQEKTGELNRSERVQKEQLEEGIDKNRQDARSVIQRMKKKKKQIARHQKTIDRITGKLSTFLKQYDPEKPKSLPSSLSPGGFQNEHSGVKLSPPLINNKLREIFTEKREGKYTAFRPSIERKRTIRKLAPRFAIILALAGGAYAMRDQIAGAFDGPGIAKQGQFRDNIEKAARITLLKRTLMDDPYLNEHFTDAQKGELLSAETHIDFVNKVNELLPGLKISDFDDLPEGKDKEEGVKEGEMLVELDPEFIKVYKRFFGENVKMQLQAFDSGGVIKSGSKYSLVLGKIQFCKPGLEFNLVIKILNTFETFVLGKNYANKHCEYGKLQNTKPLGYEGSFLMVERDNDDILNSPYVTEEHKEMTHKAKGLEEILETTKLAMNDIITAMTSDRYEERVTADKSLSEKERKLLLFKATAFKNPFLSRTMEYGEKMMVIYSSTEEELKTLLNMIASGIENDENIGMELFEHLAQITRSYNQSNFIHRSVSPSGYLTDYLYYRDIPEAKKAIRAEYGEFFGFSFEEIVDGQKAECAKDLPPFTINFESRFEVRHLCDSKIGLDATATVLIPIIDRPLTFKERKLLPNPDPGVWREFCSDFRRRRSLEVTGESDLAKLKEEILFHPMIIRYVNESHVLDGDRDQFVADFNALETVETVDAYLRLILEELVREKIGEEDFLEIIDNNPRLMLISAKGIGKKYYAFPQIGMTKALKKLFGENINVSLDFSGPNEKVEKVDPFIINEIKRFGVTDDDILPFTLAIEGDDLCIDDSRFIIETVIPVGNLHQRFIASFGSPFAGKCDLVKKIKR